MLGGFGTAPVKSEGGTISFDDAQETFTARYTHETIALGLLDLRGSYRRQSL